MIIEQPARFLRWLYPHALWRMDPSEKAVYLTFDDGPIPEATPFVLDLLDEMGIKATFFMVGDNVRKYPELYLEVLRRGHHVGNHTFNHIGGIKWLSWKYLANVYRCDRLFKTLTPRRNINLFRPPHGYIRQCKALCAPGLHHHLSRLTQEHRQVATDVATGPRVAAQ